MNNDFTNPFTDPAAVPVSGVPAGSTFSAAEAEVTAGPRFSGLVVPVETLLASPMATPLPGGPVVGGKRLPLSPALVIVLFGIVTTTVVALILLGWQVATAFAVVAGCGLVTAELKSRLFS
ncbi:hypothetical protein [Kitasatospora cinereorecta]|uniref:SpdD-like protein n=1 Tax=Kitasatospora cinereorecta TaxID=285560 RepID=A0ABW0VQC2_9ACTN